MIDDDDRLASRRSHATQVIEAAKRLDDARREFAEIVGRTGLAGVVGRPDVPPIEEVRNIEAIIPMLLEPDYLASIGANIQAPSHRRELHHRVMRIIADLADRLKAEQEADTCRDGGSHYCPNCDRSFALGLARRP